MRENAETTKMRIVYDASARESASATSLNECLEVGPATTEPAVERADQEQILSGGNRGELEASILANSVRGADRDALCFHWLKEEQASGNIAFHQSTLWFSAVSVPPSRSYQRTFTTIQIREPKTGGRDRAQLVRRLQAGSQ